MYDLQRYPMYDLPRSTYPCPIKLPPYTNLIFPTFSIQWEFQNCGIGRRHFSNHLSIGVVLKQIVLPCTLKIMLLSEICLCTLDNCCFSWSLSKIIIWVLQSSSLSTVLRVSLLICWSIYRISSRTMCWVSRRVYKNKIFIHMGPWGYSREIYKYRKHDVVRK